MSRRPSAPMCVEAGPTHLHLDLTKVQYTERGDTVDDVEPIIRLPSHHVPREAQDAKIDQGAQSCWMKHVYTQIHRHS